MTPLGHYQKAEELMARAEEAEKSLESSLIITALVAKAGVHADLATAGFILLGDGVASQETEDKVTYYIEEIT